jgi:hypothetical protein
VNSASIAAALLVPLTAVAVSDGSVPIHVRLSDNVYVNGDRARVNVKTEKDGYLVVLRVDTEGHVRVLFPVDPTNDASVRGGREIEIRGRGGREAFSVSEKKGSGLVLAARSDAAFNFASFMSGQHWNFDALVPQNANGDPEAALLGVLDRMGDGHYDYDAVPYSVDTYIRRPGYGGFYDPWYPPFSRGYVGFYNGWSGWPWLYGPGIGIGARVVIPVRPFRGRR